MTNRKTKNRNNINRKKSNKNRTNRKKKNWNRLNRKMTNWKTKNQNMWNRNWKSHKTCKLRRNRNQVWMIHSTSNLYLLKKMAFQVPMPILLKT